MLIRFGHTVLYPCYVHIEPNLLLVIRNAHTVLKIIIHHHFKGISLIVHLQLIIYRCVLFLRVGYFKFKFSSKTIIMLNGQSFSQNVPCLFLSVSKAITHNGTTKSLVIICTFSPYVWKKYCDRQKILC